MSHSIYLYDPSQAALAQPRSLADFGDVLLALQDRSPGPNARFQRFAHLLLAGAATDWEWPGDPAATARTHAGALWNFDLPHDDPVRAMRRVIDCAVAAGLAAYDDQIGLGFLPDGRVIPAEREAEWRASVEAIDEEPRRKTTAAMRRELRAAMEAALAASGFAFDGPTAKARKADVVFFRPIEGGHQAIDAYLQGASPQFQCRINCYGFLDRITQLHLGPLRDPKLMPQPRTYYFELEDLAEGFEAKRLFVEPEERLRDLMGLLSGKALPLLDSARDVAGIDALMNDDASPMKASMWRWCTVSALAVAHLAGRPDFDRLADEIVASARTRVDGTPGALERLLACIRSGQA